MSDALRRRHDELFKVVFGSLDNARGLLRSVLPDRLVARIDWSSVEAETATHIDADLHERRSDLVFSARLSDGERAMILLAVEHQSRSDREMAWRVWRYLTLATERRMRSHPEEGLPLPIAVVVHAGPGPWTAPRWLHELWPARSAVPDELVPRFTYILDGLATVPPEILRARALSAYGRLALWALQGVGQGTLTQTLPLFAGLFIELLAAPDGRQALRTILKYLSRTETRTVQEVVTKMPEPAQKEALSFWDEIIVPRQRAAEQALREKLREEAREAGLAEGRQEGREEGREEGRLEGREAGLREMLHDQLEQKFGPLPERTRRRLEQARSEELSTWTRRVIGAGSLDDIFA